MSLGKAVIVFQNMEEEVQKFAVEQAQDSLATMFHEQVSHPLHHVNWMSVGDRHLLEEVIRDQVQVQLALCRW